MLSPHWQGMETYHLVIRGQQAGPFSLEQIRQMLARGEIQPEQPAWRQGMSDWKPLSQLLSVHGGAMPPPLPAGAPPMVKVAPKSRLWLWITLGLAGVLVVLGLVTFLIVQAVRREGSDEVSWLPLMEDRTGHEPKWRKSSFKAAGPADDPDGKTFDLIRYRSPAGELAAYLNPRPQGRPKAPRHRLGTRRLWRHRQLLLGRGQQAQ
jgi:hypothetical protein